MIVKHRANIFKSLTCEWATPQTLFDALNYEFAFTLDVAATKENAKCDRFFDIDKNGLLQRWAPERCWMNPPYGPDLEKWIRKAWEESRKGAAVVCLVPSRTDTIWFHEYALKADEIRFLCGRLRFGEGKGRATFPSCVVIFRT